MKVYLLGDLHADYKANRDYIEALPEFENDCVAVPGDVASDLRFFKQVMRDLTTKFLHVTFVPGNHDLWVRPSEGEDSFDRMGEILRICEDFGVATKPHMFQGVYFVPIFSWYHAQWDTELDAETLLFESDRVRWHHYLHHREDGGSEDDLEEIKGREVEVLFDEMWMDFHRCSWKSRNLFANDMRFLGSPLSRSRHITETTALAEEIDGFNPPGVLSRQDVDPDSTHPVISLSHFLPDPRLILPRPHLRAPRLPAVCGSNFLWERVLALQPDIHAFGHTHMPVDVAFDGIRYVQWPLGPPHVRSRYVDDNYFLPLCIYDDAADEGRSPSCSTSDTKDTQSTWDSENTSWYASNEVTAFANTVPVVSTKWGSEMRRTARRCPGNLWQDGALSAIWNGKRVVCDVLHREQSRTYSRL